MNYLKDLRIPFKGLKLGKHDYVWELNKKFFEAHDNSDVTDCNISVKLELDKSERMLTLAFEISGSLNANCDRCLDEIEIPVDVSEQYIFKFGPERLEESESVMVIPESDYQIDVAPLVYDYIVLALPIQKIHGNNGIKPDECNAQALKYLESHDEKDEIDPRWEALKKIKLDNNN